MDINIDRKNIEFKSKNGWEDGGYIHQISYDSNFGWTAHCVSPEGKEYSCDITSIRPKINKNLG